LIATPGLVCRTNLEAKIKSPKSSTAASSLVRRARRASGVPHRSKIQLYSITSSARASTGRSRQPKGFRGPVVNYQLNHCELHYRKVGGPCTLENFGSVEAHLTVCLGKALTITDQPTDRGKLSTAIDCRDRMVSSQRDDVIRAVVKNGSVLTMTPFSSTRKACESQVEVGWALCIQHMTR
jgi:hypothetical protein